MNLPSLAPCSRLALVVALAAACNEPAYEEPTGPQGNLPSGGSDAASDARVTQARTDAGGKAPMGRPPSEPDVLRQGDDAAAPSRDAGRVDDGGDAGTAVTSDEDAGPVLITTDPGTGACSLTGTYSVRGEMNVSWPGRSVGLYPLVNAGTGAAVVYARIEVDGTTKAMAARVALCGTEFPEFVAGDETFFQERYDFYVADDVWDRDSLPRWDVSWQRECDEPVSGCRLRGLTLDATLGATKWVAAPAMLMGYDHDGDDHPGFTVRTRLPPEKSADGNAYLPVPLSFATSARSETLFAAMVVRARFEATLKDCDGFEGELADPSIAIRSLGCLVRPSPMADEIPCTSEHVRFLADNVPPVTAQVSTFEGRRIRDESNCAQVRSVWKSDER